MLSICYQNVAEQAQSKAPRLHVKGLSLPENVASKVRVELTYGRAYRFLSSTLAVLPCHTISYLVPLRS